jgi:hypothetical protein
LAFRVAAISPALPGFFFFYSNSVAILARKQRLDSPKNETGSYDDE